MKVSEVLTPESLQPRTVFRVTEQGLNYKWEAFSAKSCTWACSDLQQKTPAVSEKTLSKNALSLDGNTAAATPRRTRGVHRWDEEMQDKAAQEVPGCCFSWPNPGSPASLPDLQLNTAAERTVGQELDWTPSSTGDGLIQIHFTNSCVLRTPWPCFTITCAPPPTTCTLMLWVNGCFLSGSNNLIYLLVGIKTI